jgi:diaminopimelate decarboxylase
MTFARHAGVLHADGIPLPLIADHVGTPAYVYSATTLREAVRRFHAALRGLDYRLSFAVKACPNLAVLALLREEGCGFDVVSGGELYRARKAGAKGRDIVFGGVGKTVPEMVEALKAGVLLFNVESEQELALLDRVAAALHKRARVALRVNPDVDPKTHPAIATGLAEAKFGLPASRIRDVARLAASLEHVDLVGLDAHIGSQLTDLAPVEEAIGKVRALFEALRADGHALTHLDVGGGLGIDYGNGAVPDVKAYARVIKRALKGLDATIVVEPGRALVGEAAVLLTQVLYVKDGAEKRFVVADAGMNDLARPALYDAHHEVEPAARPRRRREVVDVVGPLCETGDVLARARALPVVEPGELLAVRSAGAYGFAMASNYNARPRPCEVLVDGDRFRVIRERESYRDLVRGETA